MQNLNYSELTQYAKALANFTPEQERVVMEAGALLKPHLVEVTESFYDKLLAIPETRRFLQGRTERLKNTHLSWLDKIFTGPYDNEYTAYMYMVGVIHVRVDLPVEFMAAGMTLIADAISTKLNALYGGDHRQSRDTMAAINGVLGYSLIVMQKSYQSSMEEQLQKFLKITGITRALYQNMALAYKG
ncbi:Protoglobin [Methylomagnum ishizawai]|uniref:Protoglobin n=1 Tax=Methylomagnum ishizawai TaxID=1760988 RepID=A0A1Y6CZZ5_9GAMM|nr:protoglobin domain-containing protein [Methylomagnum ishizawai]SMF95886.1 Protoglobin [Methylomagnum ishizawai]